MFADGISWLHAWRIFYHFFLDDDSIDILFAQCAALIHSSATLTAWNSSQYGKYLRFCTEETMLEIRRYWELYLAIKDFPKSKKEALRKSFSLQMKENLQKDLGVDISTLRAAVPLFSEGCFELGFTIFKTYWTTGVLNGRSSQTPSATHANPMFAYSLAGGKFNTYYGINPISAFHLTPALAQFQSPPSCTSEIGIGDFVEAAMHQFSIWCTSFRARVNAEPSSVVIRFFSGDSIPFGQALRICNEKKTTTTGIHTRPWGTSKIVFTSDYDETSTSPAPSLFNIIDTSNLTDSLGLLNVLLVTVPLLQRRPWSVLYTNTLVRSTPGEIVTSALHDRALADIPTLSLFLGVTPSSELSPFTTYSFREEEISAGVKHSVANQFHQLISWRYPSSIIPYSTLPYPELGDEPEILRCDETHLANFLFSFYTKMFANEMIPDRSPTTLLRQSNIHYLRASFVEFLSFIRQRVQVDWEQTMDHLLRLVESDRILLLGLNSYQDLICQLYLRKAFTIASLRWEFLRATRTPGDLFDKWNEVPPVVSVILKVPRSRLRILEDTIRMDTGNPILLCDTMGLRGENLHSFIRPTFGEVHISGRHGNAQATINEDPTGWDGNSPLIISFDIPSWLLTKHAGINSIGVRLRPVPQGTKLLISKLGDIRMRIFSTTPTDKEHVYITRLRPNDPREICPPEDGHVTANLAASGVSGRAGMIDVDFDKSGPSLKATSLTIRHNVVEPNAAKLLAGGAAVSTKAISDTTMLASFEEVYDQVFRFPFPIRGDKTTTRVARKSSYIEVRPLKCCES